jgi:hypothetical protein
MYVHDGMLNDGVCAKADGRTEKILTASNAARTNVPAILLVLPLILNLFITKDSVILCSPYFLMKPCIDALRI